MKFSYLGYSELRRRIDASHPTAVALWLLQQWAWLWLRLEAPAWQARMSDLRRGFPQFHRYRQWRFGDPLRLLVQAMWLAVVRVTPRTTRFRAWLRDAAGRQSRRLRARLARGHGGYVRAMQALPAGIAGHRVLQSGWNAFRRQPLAVRRLITGLVGIALALLLAFCITQPFSYPAQALFAALLWILAVMVRRMPGRFAVLTLVALSVIVSCRYLWWRYTATLKWEDPLDAFCGLTLLGAETYSWIVLMLGYIQVAWPLDRKPAPLPADTSRWPKVDVLIPTYNEELALVRHTVYAALAMDWPADKLRIHILDDGKRAEFRDFAERIGVNYVTRDDNKHAKAGNLNRALQKLDGELVAIFDCDHMPVRSFLQVSTGWFLRDPKLALVQTPHHFFSPDPFERNLGVFRRDPNEGELFYGLVQDGNDLWNAAFFCGSCAVVRRSAIDQIGGFATQTVTEDAHTALRLHRNGWNSAYLRIPQAAGLATDSLGAHVNQRIRWARGMAQIFRIDNPLFGKGLNLFQRFCYANAMIHFLAGIPRLVFLTAPLAFLLLHAYIIHAPAIAIVLFVLPHMVHASLANDRMQGKYRRPFWGEIYETVLAWYIARPTTVALFSPSKGKFNVTDKGGMQETDAFDWQVARPYMLLAALNVAGLVAAALRFAYGPADERATVVLSSLWVCYNLIIIGGAIAVAAEVQQVRRAHRVIARRPATVQAPDGRRYQGMMLDYSNDGIGMQMERALDLPPGTPVRVLIGGSAGESAFGATVQRNVGRRLGLLLALDERQRVDFARCTFARADAWLDWHDGYRSMTLMKSLGTVFALGWRGYRRMGQFTPVDLDRTRHAGRRLLGWLKSFLPTRPHVRERTQAAAGQGEWA